MANAMQQQMSLFQEGGLEQDGGTIDPISGNDVPIGSSQEEVRDDIPAQLSEGEFVFPADVVRFIGLEKLMMMRQQAKSGLKKMEAMGQMGNSEEATMPDDLPFTMDDLELTDDSIPAYQGGSIQSFANGGSPYADDVNVQGGQMFQQQDFSMPPITTQPAQLMPIDDYQAPTVDDTPVEAPTDPLPPFNVFVPPVADEYREYINDDGIVINVPYFRGQILPGYSLPEGYRLKEVASDTPEQEGIVADVTQPEGEDREREEQLAKEAKENREKSYSNTVKKVMDENPNMTFQEVMDFIKEGNSTINIFGKEMKAPGFLFNEKDLTAAYNRNLDAYGDDFGESYSQLKPDEEERGYTFGDEADKRRAEAAAKKAAQEKAEAEAAAYQKSRLIAKQKAEEEFAKKVAEEKRLADAIKEAEKQSKIKSAAQAIADRKKEAAKREAAAEANRKRIANEAAQNRREQDAAQRREQDKRDAEERDRRQSERDAAQRERERDTRQQRDEKSQSKREGGRGYVRAKGGIIERPKKKMKRGGLASKK